MINYKIYPLPGLCDKTLAGSFDAGSLEVSDAPTLGGLLDAIAEQDGVDFTAGVELLALLDGKPLDLFANRDKVLGENSELFILPMIMGG